MLFIFLFVFANVYPAFCDDFSDEAINETAQEPEKEEELMFAPIDLDLSIPDKTKPQKNKRLLIRVEKNDKPEQIKNTNQIWDGSKIYHYQYYGDMRNLNPISATGVLGSSLTTKIDNDTTVTVGQDGMDSYNGYTLSFIYNNGSVYNSGAKITGSKEKFDYSLGAYTQTATLEKSYGGVISSKPTHILNSKGTFAFGSSLYTNLNNDGTINTAGVFSEYQRGKFALGGQISQSAYSNGSNMSSSIHILPEYKFNEHISLRSKLVQNMTTQEAQEEIGLSFRPFKSEDSVRFDITGTNYHNNSEITRQRVKFSTSFRL